ncbi:MAG: hypothetical protein DRI77_02460 [Chloroflexi bacterium]|nr:MAG: hypothetical protein DRI77_02460 [Chloroflexota bacterium]
MPAYNTARFDPPAPLARVTLRNPSTGATQLDVLMLLDSGADVTLIPQATVSLLEAAAIPNSKYELAGFDGNVSLASVVRLELLLCGRTFRGRFLLIDQEWGILGRNVLNSIPVLLDGPHLAWDEYCPG